MIASLRHAVSVLLVLGLGLANPVLGSLPGRTPVDPDVEAPANAELRPLASGENARILREVYERVEKLRGIDQPRPVDAYVLTADALREMVVRTVEKEFPLDQRRASQALLWSVGAVDEDFDILEMYLAFLEEQAAGIYDESTKRLYVHEAYDLAESGFARLILAHEICHALQDHAYGIRALGQATRHADDQVLAVTCLLEGDAMLLMQNYALHYGSADMMQELPKMLDGGQDALADTPHFFRQILMLPYIQGQAFVQALSMRGPDAREALFRDPPKTTEQVLHFTEKYLGERDVPSSLSLRTTGSQTVVLPPGLSIPEPPGEDYVRREYNSLGELGLRSLLEEPLGTGLAWDAAAGWDGDVYEAWEAPDGRWWFRWESAWDSERDAEQAATAWLTLWRSRAGDNTLGDPHRTVQKLRAGNWTVTLQRAENRLVMSWGN